MFSLLRRYVRLRFVLSRRAKPPHGRSWAPLSESVVTSRSAGRMLCTRQPIARASRKGCSQVRSSTSSRKEPLPRTTVCGLFRWALSNRLLKCGCPILPVALCGTRNVLRDGAWLPRLGKVSVVASPVIKPAGQSWRSMVGLRDAVRSEILKHCGEGAFDAVVAGAPRQDSRARCVDLIRTVTVDACPASHRESGR